VARSVSRPVDIEDENRCDYSRLVGAPPTDCLSGDVVGLTYTMGGKRVRIASESAEDDVELHAPARSGRYDIGCKWPICLALARIEGAARWAPDVQSGTVTLATRIIHSAISVAAVYLCVHHSAGSVRAGPTDWRA
jgi:hypothetical protein